MSDDLPEPEGPDQGRADNRSDSDESDGSQKWNVWIDILDVAGGSIFGFVGVGLSDAGFHDLAYLFYFLAVACSIGIVRHHIGRSRVRRLRALVFWSLMAADAALFTTLALYRPPVEQLRFGFALTTDDAPDSAIPLTNDFLVKIPSTNMTPAGGMIVLPLPRGKTNATLVFSVVNDSPKTAEDLQCLLTFPEEIKGELDPPWVRAVLRSPGRNITIGLGMVTNVTQSWAYTCGTALLAGNSYTLPQIRLPQLPMEEPQVFELLARAKDFPPQVLKFELYPVVLTNGSHKAFAFKPKRIDDFRIQFSQQELEDEAQK